MATSQHTMDPISAFRYIGGDPSVDFVNTTRWTDSGPDWFASYDRVLEWALGALVIDRHTADALRLVSSTYPARATRVLSDAVTLRALLERILFALASNSHAADQITELNDRWLATSLTETAIVHTRDGQLTLGWPRGDSALESPLWVVARAAAALITSGDASRIRQCGGDDCGWYFVDRSRNGLRRWCEMATCGTRMKSHRRADRNARNRLDFRGNDQRRRRIAGGFPE